MIPAGFSQNPQWTNYTDNDNYARNMAFQGNTVWVATLGVVVCIDRLTGVRTFVDKSNSGLPSQQVMAIFCDSADNIWFGHDLGLTKYDGNTWVNYNTGNSGLPHNFVQAITEDYSGNLWVGTEGGLARFDGALWKAWPNFGRIGHLSAESNGAIWFTPGFQSMPGLHLARMKDTIVSLWDTSSAIIPGVITDLYIDSMDAKWIATYDGLCWYKDTVWNVFNTGNSAIPNNTIYSVSVNESGAIWLGTSNLGVLVFSDTSFSSYTSYNTNNSGLTSYSVYKVRFIDQQAWIVGYFSFFLFDGNSWTSFDLTNSGLPSPIVRCIAISDSDVKYIGTSNGLVKFDGNTWQVMHIPYSSFSDITCVELDPFGNVWVGTAGGVAKHNGMYWTVFTPQNSGMAASLIRSMKFDCNGKLWMGTLGVLMSFDGNIWSAFNLQNGGIP